MAVILSSCIKVELLDWASKAGTEEVCGLLLGQGNEVEQAVLTQNVAESRTRHFEIDPKALLAANKASRSGGPQIVGYFHSHPDPVEPVPSDMDIASAANDGRYWLIIGCGEVKAWLPRPDGDGKIEAFEPVAIIEG